MFVSGSVGHGEGIEGYGGRDAGAGSLPAPDLPPESINVGRRPMIATMHSKHQHVSAPGWPDSWRSPSPRWQSAAAPPVWPEAAARRFLRRRAGRDVRLLGLHGWRRERRYALTSSSAPTRVGPPRTLGPRLHLLRADDRADVVLSGGPRRRLVSVGRGREPTASATWSSARTRTTPRARTPDARTSLRRAHHGRPSDAVFTGRCGGLRLAPSRARATNRDGSGPGRRRLREQRAGAGGGRTSSTVGASRRLFRRDPERRGCRGPLRISVAGKG